MAVVDAEHERLQTQCGGHLCRGGQRRHRRELIVEMVGDRQRGKPEAFDLAGELGPLARPVREAPPERGRGTQA